MSDTIDTEFVIVTSKGYPTPDECYNLIKIYPETIEIIKKLNYSSYDKVYVLHTKSDTCTLCLEYLIKKLNYSICNQGYLLQSKYDNRPVCREFLLKEPEDPHQYYIYLSSAEYSPLNIAYHYEYYTEWLQNYSSQKLFRTYGETIGSNIITEYILFDIFKIEYPFYNNYVNIYIGLFFTNLYAIQITFIIAN